MTQFFSNPYNITSSKLQELVTKWDKYENEIDSQTLLNQIKYTLGMDYYPFALEWFRLFKESEWWREDLR